jgi:hypothetical protein
MLGRGDLLNQMVVVCFVMVGRFLLDFVIGMLRHKTVGRQPAELIYAGSIYSDGRVWDGVASSTQKAAKHA